MTFDLTNPAEGIYPNLPEPIYRGAKGISQTQLKKMEFSSSHYFAAINAPPKLPTPDQIIGILTHALVLEDKELFVVLPEDAPKKPTKAQLGAKKPSQDTQDAIAWWNSFRMANPGKEIIEREEADQLYNIRNAVVRHPIAGEILLRSRQFEVGAFKRHSTGLMMKGRADCLCVDDKEMTTVPDLKTCGFGGASAQEFSWAIYNWGYHRQAAYYLDVFGATYFVFIAVEKEPPYSVACYHLTPESIAKGREENERDLQIVAQCEQSGIWPGYPQSLARIGLPPQKLKEYPPVVY